MNVGDEVGSSRWIMAARMVLRSIDSLKTACPETASFRTFNGTHVKVCTWRKPPGTQVVSPDLPMSLTASPTRMAAGMEVLRPAALRPMIRGDFALT